MGIPVKSSYLLFTQSTVLKTTVTLLLAFLPDPITAATCPAYITASIPGVCEIANGSVTVANGGSIGGIDGNGNNTIENITVLEGGSIANGHPARSGIAIVNSTVSGGISNAGFISAGDAGIAVINNSVVNGDLSNAGLIIADTGSGITIEDSIVFGSISNTGSIIAGDAGIAIFGHLRATETGGILNTGSIFAGSGSGITIEDASVSGGILNTASIAAKDAGIAIFGGSSVSENIVNTGSITAKDGSGITIEDSEIGGGIYNAGLISAHDAGIAIFGHHHLSSAGSVTNTGSIITQNGSAITIEDSTIRGNISNEGLITAEDAGIAVFGNSAISGGISNGGSIKTKSGSGLLVEYSTVAGGIINTGQIFASDTGIAVFDSASVVGGILNSGIIQGDRYAIYIDDTSIVENLNIIGQNSRIIGNVYAVNTIVNITSGSHFTTEGDFNVQHFNVESSAFFNMAHSITTGTLTNGGILYINHGSSPKFLSGDGNYTQETGGLFQIAAKNTTNYGQLSASGAVNLTNSGAFDVLFSSDSSFRPGDILNNVISGNSLMEPINDYIVTDNSYLWSLVAGMSADHGINLTIQLNPEAYSTCRGTYCAKAAAVIIEEISTGNAGFGAFVPLQTAADFTAAVAQSTPELINENIPVTQLISRAVMDTLPRWGSTYGLSSWDGIIYRPGKLWIKPYTSSMAQHQRTTVNGYNANAYGIVLGKDVQFTEDTMLGAALAGGYDKIQGNTILQGQSIKTNSYQGVVYATKHLPYNMYLAGQSMLGVGLNQSERSMPLIAGAAKGNFHSWFTNLIAEAGWSCAINSRFRLTEVINASYVYINQAGFTETGSMALDVKSNNNSSLLFLADTHAAYHVATGLFQQSLTLTAHAGFGFPTLNTQPTTTAAFIAGGPKFSTYGIQYNDLVYRTGIGLFLDKRESPVSLSLRYDQQNGNNGQSGFFSATFKYKT